MTDKTVTVIQTEDGHRCSICGGRLVWIQKGAMRQCLGCLRAWTPAELDGDPNEALL